MNAEALICRRAIGADGSKSGFMDRAAWQRFCRRSRKKRGWGFTDEARWFDECQRCALGRKVARGEDVLAGNVVDLSKRR